MQKVYGSRNIREEAGLTKFIKKSLPPPVKEWSSSVDKVLDETRHFVDEVIESAGPMLASGVSSIVRDTTALFNTYPARLTITRISPDLAGVNPKDYTLSIAGTSATSPLSERATGKESLTARVNKDVKTHVLEYGAPIRVKWTAPVKHSKKDWIGLYMVTDNRSRDVTEVSSLGRWVPTSPGYYGGSNDHGVVKSDEPVADSDLVCGEVLFEGDRLWWTQGVFEFRYHHDGSHQVISVSEPFEVRIGRFDEESDEGDDEAAPFIGSHHVKGGLYEQEVAEALLPVVRNCLDRDPDIAPATADERFGSHVERDSKYAKRVVYAIRNMFGIEFAPAVVPADGNVRRLAWRVCNAKQVLVSPFFFFSFFVFLPFPSCCVWLGIAGGETLFGYAVLVLLTRFLFLISRHLTPCPIPRGLRRPLRTSFPTNCRSKNSRRNVLLFRGVGVSALEE